MQMNALPLVESLFLVLELAQREFLMFSAVFLLTGAVNELVIDAIWAVQRIYRHCVYHRLHPPPLAYLLGTKLRSLTRCFKTVPGPGKAAIANTASMSAAIPMTHKRRPPS